jgi:anthranilate/para-aminobenzoate synthase component II
LQGIVQFFGGKLYNLESVRHGIEVIHKVNGEHLFFKGIPKNHTVGLYHSWAVSKHQFPEELMITSNSEEDIIMSIQHKKLPIFGVQYHPESVMSEYGLKLIQNWLEI